MKSVGNIGSLSIFAAVITSFLWMQAASADATAAPAASSSAAAAPTRSFMTGSAVLRKPGVTPSPLLVITAQQIKASGLTSVSDVLRSLSADNSGSLPTAFTNGFTTGASGVALRGLTLNSTLVLIDGRRTAPYALADDGERSFTDLNSIPLNSVARIEVLLDGASALYGSDAIGGVVNIITYPSYTGSKATAEVGTSQHGGGAETRLTYLTGTGDLEQDHYNGYFNFEWQRDAAIYNKDRTYENHEFDGANYSDASLDPMGLGGQDFNAGNPFNAGSNYGAVGPAYESTPGDITSGVSTGPFQTLHACDGSRGPTQPETGPGVQGAYCEQNFVDQYGEVMPEVDRVAVSARTTLKLSDSTQLRNDLSYMQVRVSGSQAPNDITVGTPTDTKDIVLPALLLDGKENPNDPFRNDFTTVVDPVTGKSEREREDALISYSFGDIPAGFTTVNHNLRWMTDMSGTLGGDWNYDTALTLNHTWLNSNFYGYLNYDQLVNDIDTGAYSFVNPSTNPQSVRDALSPALSKTSTTDLDSWDFGVDRDLTQLAGGPLGLALGAQWRYEAQDDPALNPGNQALGLGNTISIGHRNVAAVYAELDAPVLQSLEIDLSGREDKYSDFGSVFSPKLGIKWAPTNELSFRGTYAKGFRAPSFSESGTGSSSEGFTTVTFNNSCQLGMVCCGLPCQSGGDPYHTQPYALGLETVGNPALQSERSRSYTLGVVYQPTDTFSGSIGYYNILKTDAIAVPSAGPALAAYFNGQPIPEGYFVTPDLPDPLNPSALPRPLVVGSAYDNQSQFSTTGFDLDLNYTRDLSGASSWVSEFHGTKLLTFTQTFVPGGTAVSYVGTQSPFVLSSGAGTPRIRWSWANTLDLGTASMTLTMYYVSNEYMDESDIRGPGSETVCSSPVPGTNNCIMPSFWHADLTGAYPINSSLSLNARIMNLTDAKPSFDPVNYAATNYNPTYDEAGIVGRFYGLGLRVTF